MTAPTPADLVAAWHKYADSIEVDHTAPTVYDDFHAGWKAAVERLTSSREQVTDAELERLRGRIRGALRFVNEYGDYRAQLDKICLEFEDILHGDDNA
jgi:hypothetical protein